MIVIPAKNRAFNMKCDDGDSMKLETLQKLVGGPIEPVNSVLSAIEAENIKLPGDKTLERSWKYDKEAFIAAWKSAGGNISKLATMLDVSRVTLYRYLKKYGLGPKAK